MYQKLAEAHQIIALNTPQPEHPDASTTFAPVASYANRYSGPNNESMIHHLHVIVLNGAYTLVREFMRNGLLLHEVEKNVPDEMKDAPIGEKPGSFAPEPQIVGAEDPEPFPTSGGLASSITADIENPPAPAPLTPPPAGNTDTMTSSSENGSSEGSASGSPAPEATDGSGTAEPKDDIGF